MAWSDDILGLATGPTRDAKAYEAATARLGTLPMEALVRGWRELSLASLRDRTPGVDLFGRYFDGLGANHPQRACDFILAEVESEDDDEIVALIAREKLLMQLLHQHGALVAHRLEAAALEQPRLRWLLGGVAWAIGGMIQDEELKALLLSMADRSEWDRWVEEMEGPAPPSFATMPVPELARAWVEIMPRSPLDRERDDAFHAFFNYQSDVVTEDPARGLALVTEVLRIETHQRLLSLLAASLLENLICTQKESVIVSVEAEAQRNERFRWLLGGVWYSRVASEVARRIDAAKGGISW